MSKCDFCDNPRVGYTLRNSYCDEHEEQAKKLDREFWEQVEKDLEGSEEYGD